MTDAYEHVYATVTACGIPGTLEAYPVGEVPALPWFVYLLDDGGEFPADDTDYAGIPRFRVELYEETRDADLESSIATAIRDAYGPVRIMPEYIPDEDCRMVAYEFAFTPKEDQS